jgi:hypothetical protein
MISGVDRDAAMHRAITGFLSAVERDTAADKRCGA